jgi:hypothetical protein
MLRIEEMKTIISFEGSWEMLDRKYILLYRLMLYLDNYLTTLFIQIGSVFSFPNMDATKLLITYGSRWIDFNAGDRVQGDTALHVISRSLKQDGRTDITAIIELLIDAGAHVDCVNKFGKTALDEAVETEIRILLRSKQSPPRLKCLCARLITDQQLLYDRLWPAQTALNTFVLFHDSLQNRGNVRLQIGQAR